MIKNNKGKLIISSAIILLPMLIGLFGAKFLPDQIAIHWGISGEADGFAGPMSFFLIIPLVLLALHWLCLMFTFSVDKNFEQNKKIREIIFWIIPFIAISSCLFVLYAALGYGANALSLVMLILALTFICIGNYMPKSTRNRTFGIKMKWTLSSDENWRATHRFGGKVYVIMGILCLLCIPLPVAAFPYVSLGVILVCVILPVVYSYIFYKKQLAGGAITEEECKKEYQKIFGGTKTAVIISIIITTVITLAVIVLMFTGDINISPTEDSLCIEASFWSDVNISYDDIDSIEYRQSGVDGTRVSGFGSVRLLLGLFTNDEFGNYTRYTYAKHLPSVVLKTNDSTVVIGLQSEEATREIYETLTAKISK